MSTRSPHPLAKLVPLHRGDGDGGTRAEPLGEQGLIAACAAGDGAARARFFERYIDVVYRVVRRLRPGADHAVEDLVQATFLQAYAAAPRFRLGEPVRPWLLGIAANLTREHARREGRRIRAMGTLAAWWSSEPAASVDALDRQRLARLPEAMAELPHDLRAVLVLVDLEGQGGRDAAKILAIPEGTVWRRLYQARRRLRVALDTFAPAPAVVDPARRRR